MTRKAQYFWAFRHFMGNQAVNGIYCHMAGSSENLWGEREYISQVELPYSKMPFGDGTIWDYGCGACSTANIVLHMGVALPFTDIVSYYTQMGQPLRAFGYTFGIMPWKICGFFNRKWPAQGLNTTAVLEWGANGFHDLLWQYRYVIAVVKWKSGGAHYIACMKNGRGGISIVDPGKRYGEMLMEFTDIDGYVKDNGGGFVIGAIGINVARNKQMMYH